MVLTVRISLLIVLCLGPSIGRAQSIQFEDVSERAGVITDGRSHGMAVADFDRDGWDDLYIAADAGRSVLFRNRGDGTFEDVTDAAGAAVPGNAVNPLWGDVNNDGYLDLFVGVRYDSSPSAFFLGTAGGGFVDVSDRVEIDMNASVGSAAFGDYDNDGRLDLFIATRDSGDRLYRNVYDGVRFFEDVSDRAGTGGIGGSIAMQATWIDYDLDNDLDLFAVHDGNLKSRLYRNPGFLPMMDMTSSSGLEVARSAMGVAWGDYDNDGWMDVYITNVSRGNLFRNRGDGVFEDVSEETGTWRNGMSWGVVFADFDNDGDEDLFIGNTYGFDRQLSFLYENRGGTFVDIAQKAGVALSTNTYGVAVGDFNNDGLVDLVVADEEGDNKLLMNRTEEAGHWVQLNLHGGSANKTAIGATVRAKAGDSQFMRTVSGGASFVSQVSPRIHIGLGEAASIDTLEVTWGMPGQVETITDVAVDARYRVAQNALSSVDRDEPREGPGQTRVIAAYPNPFTSQTAIEIMLERGQFVQLDIFDALGREIDRLAAEYYPAGRHSFRFHSYDLSPGLYFYRVQLRDQMFVGTMIRIQ